MSYKKWSDWNSNFGFLHLSSNYKQLYIERLSCKIINVGKTSLLRWNFKTFLRIQLFIQLFIRTQCFSQTKPNFLRTIGEMWTLYQINRANPIKCPSWTPRSFSCLCHSWTQKLHEFISCLEFVKPSFSVMVVFPSHFARQILSHDSQVFTAF